MLNLKAQDKEILKQIKQTILEVAKEQGIEIDKIILFGSRARGDYREDSDWDILVVTKEKLELRRKLGLLRNIKRRLQYKFSLDILFITKDEYNKRINDLGHLCGMIQKEKVII